MDLYRYRRKALKGDYVRSGLGLGLICVPLFAADAGTVGLLVLGGLVALFAMFGTRTLLRHLMTVRIDENAVVVDGLRSRSIAWPDLASVNLSYYTTRRDGAAGWMQLKMGDGRTTLRFESTLEGFTDFVERVRQESMARGITLTPKTVNNMQALGLAIQRGETQVAANGRSSHRP